MSTGLRKGDRVRLILDDGTRKSGHVKEWAGGGCVYISCGGAGVPERGSELQVQDTKPDLSRVYYMQVFDTPDTRPPQLVLRRNPAVHYNRNRRCLRVPFTAATGIRGQGETHFMSARFINISMEAACLASEKRLGANAPVSLRLQLPECREHIIDGHVGRVSSAAIGRDVFDHDLYGVVVLFKDLRGEALNDLTCFMWNRVRKEFPRQLREMFDSTRRRRTGDAAPQAASESQVAMH